MALSLIVFDCDGVILESVDAKTKAFGQVAEPLGAEARDRLLLYHTLHTDRLWQVPEPERLWTFRRR